MDVMNYQDLENLPVKEISFKGTPREVTGTGIRWLSRCGDDGTGQPAYGLRYFTIEPGGQIPIHNHAYHQTMYILEGTFECYRYGMDSETPLETVVTGPGDAVYIPGMEPHGMKNIGDTPAAFLCCIADVRPSGGDGAT